MFPKTRSLWIGAFISLGALPQVHADSNSIRLDRVPSFRFEARVEGKTAAEILPARAEVTLENPQTGEYVREPIEISFSPWDRTYMTREFWLDQRSHGAFGKIVDLTITLNTGSRTDGRAMSYKTNMKSIVPEPGKDSQEAWGNPMLLMTIDLEPRFVSEAWRSGNQVMDRTRRPRLVNLRLADLSENERIRAQAIWNSGQPMMLYGDVIDGIFYTDDIELGGRNY